MSRIWRKPTLAVINRSADPIRIVRYVPKVIGGFFTEVFEVVNREQFDSVMTPETMELFRLGKMRGQENGPPDQEPSVA